MRNLIALGLAAALLVGCGRAEPRDEPGTTSGAVLGASACTTLFAGQTVAAGQLCVWSDSSQLYVEYDVVEPWTIKEAQTWVGLTANYPTNPSGNVAPGQFPYASGWFDDVTRHYTETIPLAALPGLACDGWIYLLGHAAVRDTSTCHGETAWADGAAINPGGRGNWATLAHLQVGCLPPPPPPALECETAFARVGTGARCFDEYGFSRWGWTNELPDSLPTEGLELPLYAGAAHCAYQDAPVAGTLLVRCEGNDLHVVYEPAQGVVFDETQLYVGDLAIPEVGPRHRQTVAPGQFPYQEPDGDYVLEGACEDLPEYLIAHAVACFADEGGDPVPDPCDVPQ